MVAELCGRELGEMREALSRYLFIVNLKEQGKETRNRTSLEELLSQPSWNGKI